MNAKDFQDIPMVYLRLKREAFGMNQKEFATIFDMSWDCYRKYEEGTRRPVEYAYRMMKLLIEYYEKEHMING